MIQSAMKPFGMLAILAAFIAAGQLASPSTAIPLDRIRIIATIGHSEGCPSGNVILDLPIGSYVLTPRAARSFCKDMKLNKRVISGTLRRERIAAMQSASQRVLSEGLQKPACRERGRPENIIVSNGGTPILVITDGITTTSAPDDFTCWSEAANSFYEVLDEAFTWYHYR